MLKPIHIVTVCIVCFLSACCPKLYPQVQEHTRVEYRDSIIHDSAYFEVPVIVEKIVTRDTSSHLENDWAESDASYTAGLLYHSLQTRPHKVVVPVNVVVKGSVISREDSIIKTEYIEKSLTKWQQFQMEGFWLLIALFALYISIKSLLR